MPLDTKTIMILAAERRFALHGLEGTSLRQIALDSDQRNESAAHYHFGSREGLIRAILNYRIPRINERREKWLNGQNAVPEVSRQNLIASAVIYPMAEEIFANWRDCYWVRFISQLFSIGKFRLLAEEFQSQSPALRQAYDMLVTVPGVDRAILDVRIEILRSDVVWGLARVEALSFQESRAVCELHVANLVDMIASGIAAKPSPETLRRAAAVYQQNRSRT
jgi:AcrR family transcriptional regulator